MDSGLFITFEGLDGAGKSTQLRLLASALRERGRQVREMRQPGGTALGDQLRSLLLEQRGKVRIAPHAELAMMFADRAQAIDEIVRPALAGGETVVCDRWTDSTEAYQGAGRDLGVAIVHALDNELCAGLRPDLTILLMPPLKASLARARRRNTRSLAGTGREESRFEAESDTFFEQVYAQYRLIAVREPVRVVTIEDDAPVEAIHRRIVEVVLERLSA